MRQAASLAVAPSPVSLPVDRALEAWHARLVRLHFTPWRIDRDLKAVTACLQELGPPDRWTDPRLARRFERRRGGRAVNDAPLAELAVRRFRAFCEAPEEGALEAEILAAWWDRLLVRGRKLKTLEKYRDAVLRYGDSAGPVWRGSLHTMDRFGARQVGAGCARESLRASQGAVRRFINFAGDPADEWAERVEASTGCRLRQIATPSNTIAHLHSCPEGEVGRAFTDVELRRFFAGIRNAIDAAVRSRRKGRWNAARDYAMYQLMLATGARDSDFEGLKLSDLPAAYGPTAAFSRFEEVHFLGKSDPGGPPKPRIVPAIAFFASQWATLDWYLREVRPQLVRPHSADAVFLSERGRPLGANDVSRIFREHRVAADLPPDLHAHCLRHTFAQRLRALGVDLAIIQKLLGHNVESTTARYAKLTQSYIKDRLLECARRQRHQCDADAG